MGNDHDVAASAVVAAVVDAVVVVDDDGTAAVVDEDAELDVLDDLWLLPPHAAIATVAATAAATVAARPSPIDLIVYLFLA